MREYLNNVYTPWAKNHHADGQILARLKSCFDAEFGGKRLHEITPWLIEKWRTRKLKTGRTAATVNRDVTCLKAALNHAVDWDILDANPLAKIKPLKIDQTGIVRYLDDDEEARLRDALTEREATARAERNSANVWRAQRGYPPMPALTGFTDHLRPIVLLALNTGLRRGELFKLRWDNIDFDHKTLTVRGASAKSKQTRHCIVSV